MTYIEILPGGNYPLIQLQWAPAVQPTAGAPSEELSAYSEAVLADNPIGYWRLGDTGTTAADEMGDYDGTYAGGYTQGQTGAVAGGDTAVLFDGVSGTRITIPDTLPTLAGSALSIEAWVKPDFSQTTGEIFGAYQTSGGFPGYGLIHSHSGPTRSFAYWDSVSGAWRVSTTLIPNDAAFHHIAVTVSAGGSIKLYLDGAHTGDTFAGATPGSYTGVKRIGSHSGGNGNQYKGTLDEVALYDHELSAARIAAHYDAAPELTGDYVDITTRCRGFQWQWGRNDELGEFEPGSGYVLLDNRDRAFDPDYAAGPWYGNIKPRRIFRLKAKVGVDEYTVLLGYARGFPQAWPSAGYDAIVQVELVDYTAVLATFELPAGFTRDAELTGARVNAVLDAIGFPAGSPARAIDQGTVTVAEILVETAGTSALQHIRDCVDAEFGQFFDHYGVPTFHDRARRLGLGTALFPGYDPYTALYDFADARGVGADARYDNSFQLAYDDAYLVNYMRVDGPDPSVDEAAIAEDSGSQADYWPWAKTIASQAASDPDRLALAQYHVLRYAQPEYRVPGLSFQLGGQDTDQERKNILAATVSDPVTVTRFADAAAPITLSQHIEGVAHAARPGGPWTVALSTSPADTRTYFTLEDATYGALDDADILIAP